MIKRSQAVWLLLCGLSFSGKAMAATPLDVEPKKYCLADLCVGDAIRTVLEKHSPNKLSGPGLNGGFFSDKLAKTACNYLGQRVIVPIEDGRLEVAFMPEPSLNGASNLD